MVDDCYTIKAAILDFDGFFYKYTADAFKILDQVGAQSVTDLAQNAIPSHQNVYQDVVRAVKTGSWTSQFSGAPYHIDQKTLFDYHNQNIPLEIIEPCQETATAIADMDDIGVKMIILTHGSKAWVRKALDFSEQATQEPLSNIFPDDLILDLSDTNFIHKHESAEPFLMALDRLNDVYGDTIHPTQCLVGEDTKANLFFPYQAGMKTLLVTHGQPVKAPIDGNVYVNEMHNNLAMTASILKMRHRQTLNDALGGPEL